MAKKPPPEKLPWSPGGKRLARALAACSFLPGSWDKRFARDMASIAESDDREPGKYGITLAQKQNLIRLAHKYRRQIPNWGQLIFEPAPPPKAGWQTIQQLRARLMAEFHGRPLDNSMLQDMKIRLAQMASDQHTLFNLTVEISKDDPNMITITGTTT